MQIRYRASIAAAIMGFCGVTAFWTVSRAQGQTQQKLEYFASGVFAIAGGQTARINIVTVGIPASFPVEMIFFDSQGNVLARDVQTASPGRAISLDLRFPTGRTGRLPVRALYRWPAQGSREGYVLRSVEVIDDITGKDTAAWIDWAG